MFFVFAITRKSVIQTVYLIIPYGLSFFANWSLKKIMGQVERLAHAITHLP